MKQALHDFRMMLGFWLLGKALAVMVEDDSDTLLLALTILPILERIENRTTKLKG